MDSSNTQLSQHHLHQQETLESMLVCTKSQQKEKPKPPAEQAQKCPRCDSTNTKFCYYNNYSLSQPRYFCKSCRRYWTKGGTLRNVPVGGGCRKNRRSSASSKRIQESPLNSLNSNLTPMSSLVPPFLSYDSSDLTLAFARLQRQNSGRMGFDEDNNEFPMMGNIGNMSSVNSSPSVGLQGLYDGIRNHGFLENTPNGFNNYFYGNNMNNGNMGYAENGALGMQLEEMSGGATAVTAVKQEELSNLRNNNGESRVIWGLPWQMHGDGNMGAATTTPALETAGRQSWNGLFNMAWSY